MISASWRIFFVLNFSGGYPAKFSKFSRYVIKILEIPKMSRCLKGVAVKDGELILCEVRATPRNYLLPMGPGPDLNLSAQVEIDPGPRSQPELKHKYECTRWT